MIVIEVEKEERERYRETDREIERRLEKEEEEDTHSPPANNNKKNARTSQVVNPHARDIDISVSSTTYSTGHPRGEHLRGKSISQKTHTQKKEQEVDGNNQQQISKEKDQYIARSTARVQKRSIETVTAAACARMFFCVGRNRSFSSAPRKRGSKRAGVKDPIVTAQRGPTLFRLFFFSSCFF